MNNLEIISLTKLLLKDAIAKNKFWGDTYEAPFSINKAKWMLENSRADDDDTLAVLGYENYEIIAFVSLMPDLIKLEEGVEKKISWSQRWWVSDKYKETVLSTYVKNISMNACNNQVIIKFLGDNTKAYYEKQPFEKFSKRKRYIILFSLDYDILVLRKNSLKKIAPILKFTDSLSRRFVTLINKRTSNKISKGITYQNILSIDDATWNFIEKKCIDDIVPKSKAYINWQIDNNQYYNLKTSEEKAVQKCLLGSISTNILNASYILKKDDEIIGFISGFISSNKLMIKYFVTSKDYYDDCLNILIKSLITFKCTMIQTEDAILGERIKDKFFTVYADDKALVSLVHKDVNDRLENMMTKDQDGNFF